MTTPRTSAANTSANATQVRRLARRHVVDIFETMAWSTAVGAVITLIGWLLARWFAGRASITIEGEQVYSTWFAVPLGVAFVSVFVHQIVMGAGYSRIPIAMGASRRNLTFANLISTTLATLALGLGAVLVYFLETSFNLEMVERLFDLAALGDPSITNVILVGMVGVFSVLLFGLAVGVVFVRYHWLVGTLTLVILLMVLPILANRFHWNWYFWLGEFGLAQHLVASALAGAAYILMMRRIPVP